MEEKPKILNKLVFHPDFRKVAEEINKSNIRLPPPVSQDLSFDNLLSNKNTKVTSGVEKEGKFKLDPKKGSEVMSSRIGVVAYDESINKFLTLEGAAYLISHSLTVVSEKDYLPSNFVTFNFYTKSKIITKDSKFIKYSEDPEKDSNKDYHQDRTEFIVNNVPENSIILIDGPLIGEQATAYTLKLNQMLLKKGVLPIFFVKNSNSDLVIENIAELKGKYNSDLHWAHEVLKVGERTCLFRYTDLKNSSNTKLFCYIKAFGKGAQRVELHPDTYEKFKGEIPAMMNMVYYLMIAQGDPFNPQVRPIAIAEKYARETIKIVNFSKLMNQLNITPTMNQARGF